MISKGQINEMLASQRVHNSLSNIIVHKLGVNSLLDFGIFDGRVVNGDHSIPISDIIGIKIDYNIHFDSAREYTSRVQTLYVKSSLAWTQIIISVAGSDGTIIEYSLFLSDDEWKRLNSTRKTKVLSSEHNRIVLDMYYDELHSAALNNCINKIRKGEPINVGDCRLENNGITFQTGILFKKQIKIAYSDIIATAENTFLSPFMIGKVVNIKSITNNKYAYNIKENNAYNADLIPDIVKILKTQR